MKGYRFSALGTLFVLIPIYFSSFFNLHAATPYKQQIQAYIKPSDPIDEAMASYLRQDFSDRAVQALFNGADEDYFQAMDKKITAEENSQALYERLSPYLPGQSVHQLRRSAVIGRNNWMVYTGGNDRFWTHLGGTTVGGGQLDFLKTLSNHPKATSVRSKRWQELGLINEPCFQENLGPREDRWGLWLDKRSEGCGPDPFENRQKYPGVKIGSRGTHLTYNNKTILHDSSSYGFASGVVGLRLFPNPDFDQKAAKAWDAEKYYTSPEYYNDPKLVKPYRVGMACAFCHVGPEVSNLPKDFNAPKWENLSSTVGAQYFWVDRIFFWNYKKNNSNLVYQLLHTSRPGALDTSLVSSDQINNPRTMNAIYDLPSRVLAAQKFKHEDTLQSTNRENKQFQHFLDSVITDSSPLLELANSDRDFLLAPKRKREVPFDFKGSIDVTTPRILKDGSDSAGILASLNRVYINIGLFSEEWMKHFVPLLGASPIKKITPFDLQVAESNSLYWQANTHQTPHLANFFLAAGRPDKLKVIAKAPQPATTDEDFLLARGQKVFANNCLACHSSKQPEEAYSFFAQDACKGPGYLNCWENYWDYVSNDPDYKLQAEKLVKAKDFLKDNFMSTDLRVPVSLLGVQTCSSEATNGIQGNIWDHFTSDSYKQLSSVKGVDIVTLSPEGKYISEKRDIPGGGRGFIRPPSLISLWSTAPFLSNNSLGLFDGRGTVAGRLSSFDHSINGLLYPQNRGPADPRDPSKKEVSYSVNGKVAKGVVDVFSKDSYVRVPRNYFPKIFGIDTYKLIPSKLNLKDKPDDTLMNGDLKRMARTQIKNIEQFGKHSNSYEDYSYRYIENGFDKKEDIQNSLGENLVLGPFPKGFPVNLIANINLRANKLHLASAVLALIRGFKAVKNIIDEEEALKVFTKITASKLKRVSKCPDLVVNKGHYFGTEYLGPNSPGLSDQDKKALIEYLKQL